MNETRSVTTTHDPCVSTGTGNSSSVCSPLAVCLSVTSQDTGLTPTCHTLPSCPVSTGRSVGYTRCPGTSSTKIRRRVSSSSLKCILLPYNPHLSPTRPIFHASVSPSLTLRNLFIVIESHRLVFLVPSPNTLYSDPSARSA